MLPGDRARKVVEKVDQHCLPPSCFARSHQATHDTVDPIPAALQSAMEPTTREPFGRGCWEPFITAYIKDEWRKGGGPAPSASLVVSFRVSPDGSRIG